MPKSTPIVKQFDKRHLAMDPATVTLEHERQMMRKMHKGTQRTYFDCSLFTLGASRAIVHQTFDGFVDGRPDIAEFGSGVHGRLYNLYVPKKYCCKWRQFDINPVFVEENKKFTQKQFSRFPEIHIGDIYDMPLGNESVDVITGLSSWDSVFFFDLALKEVYRCLRPDGLFIHFQDMLPAEYPLLAEECRKREEKGMRPEFSCAYRTCNAYPEPWLVAPCKYLVGLESIDDANEMLTTSRYLTQHLARTAQRHGLRVLKNETVERTIEKRRYAFNHPFWWLTLRDNGCNNLYVSPVDDQNDASYDPSVPEGHVRLTAYMDVLVAQKT